MKKILCIFCCCLLSLPVLAGYWAQGTSGACFVHAKYNTAGTKDEFYYCGDQDTGCAGVKDGSGDTDNWYYYGDKEELTFDNTLYYCCTNKWVVAGANYANSFTYTETITNYVEGGTCTYQRTTDACGGVTDIPCTKATTCISPYFERNGECVRTCQMNGYAFKSSTSNTCISCPTTKFSGIDSSGTCINCAPTQFFDTSSKKCEVCAKGEYYNGTNGCSPCGSIEKDSKTYTLTSDVNNLSREEACYISGTETDDRGTYTLESSSGNVCTVGMLGAN